MWDTLELPTAYDPTAIEQRWAEYWVREKLFRRIGYANAEFKPGKRLDT